VSPLALPPPFVGASTHALTESNNIEASISFMEVSKKLTMAIMELAAHSYVKRWPRGGERHPPKSKVCHALVRFSFPRNKFM